MAAELTATVENGGLKLDAALPFPERTRVRLVVEPVGEADAARAAWDRIRARLRERPIHGGAGRSPVRNFMNAVDTNVLVYAFDADDPTRQSRAEALLEGPTLGLSEGVLLWQVAGEFLNVLRKWESSGRLSAADVVAHFRDVLALWPLHLPTAEVFDRSFDLRTRYSLSHWDGLLIAACRIAGVRRLYSEDMQDGADCDGVRIDNPFT